MDYMCEFMFICYRGSIKFVFPNDTPHLDDEQRKAYLVQAILQQQQTASTTK